MTALDLGPARRATSPMSATRRPRPGWLRRLGRVLAALLLAVLLVAVSGLAWFALGDEAEAADLAQALVDHAVVVTEDGGVLTIAPADPTAATAVGVAFLPGTRVQPDAYVATWAPIVEATGVTVHITAVPLNLPALAGDAITDMMAANPATTTWVIGGHSMGGFKAAESVVDPAFAADGLLLWAAGPGKTDMSGASVPTLLVAGGSDAILPPDVIVDTPRLAPETTVEVIEGMVHGQFGRYSETEAPLDPERRSDAATLADLVAVTTTFLEQVALASDGRAQQP